MIKRNVYYSITIASAVLLALALIIIFESDKAGIAAISGKEVIEISSLPQNKKDAQKELNKISKILGKLQPASKYIVIDTHANILTLRTTDKILFKADCSTGSGGELVDSTTGRHWIFNTPHGTFKLNSKIADPWWRKPDWAYIEESEKPPSTESERYDPEMMGEYAMGFGDGYFIHGTIYERLIGVSVTHGCVRLAADDLRYLYDRVSIGTPVFIF